MPFPSAEQRKDRSERQAATKNPGDSLSQRPPDFAAFAVAISNERLDEAGQILASILQIDQSSGQRAALQYFEHYQRNREVQQKAMGLRVLIEQQKTNEALILVYELFGLQGPIAIQAISALKSRLDT